MKVINRISSFILLFSLMMQVGCTATQNSLNSSNTDASAIVQSNVESVISSENESNTINISFKETSKSAIQQGNPFFLSESTTGYNFAYTNNGIEYITLLKDNEITLTERDGSVEKNVDKDAWQPFAYGNRLFYISYDGATFDAAHLNYAVNGECRTAIEEVEQVIYGDESIYYTLAQKLYSLNPATLESVEVSRLNDSWETVVVYDGKVWLPEQNGYIEEASGKFITANLGWSNFVAARGGWIYYLNGGEFNRINAKSLETENLPNMWTDVEGGLIVNFTDEYMIYAAEGKLYKTDSKFSETISIECQGIKEIYGINISDNNIFVLCSMQDKDFWQIVKIDIDGSIITNYGDVL